MENGKMLVTKVTIDGVEREKDEYGRFRCLKCGKFEAKRKPGRDPNKYCDGCAKEIKKGNLKKGETHSKPPKVKTEKVISTREENTVYGFVMTPAGDYIPIVSEEEKVFYEERRDTILKNYDFSGAELDLLKTFLQLALEEKRLESISLNRSDPRLIKSLMNVSEMKVKIQQSLGITRDQRIERTEAETVEGAVESIIARFKKFREENKDRFVWRCKKCGSKNVESRINPDYKNVVADKDITQVIECTPTLKEDNK